MRAWKARIAAAVLGTGLLASQVAAKGPDTKTIRRGEYLVGAGGCNDCHTPWKLGPNGPAPDRSRLLSGHPEDLKMPPPATLQGPWMASVSATMTAWAGPWGVSYSANLTPDPDTGLGRWTQQNFFEAMRSGRHMGRGRPILPPMPFQNVAALTDSDLHAMFAYLRSIPAVRNRVPDPTPPEMAAGDRATATGSATGSASGPDPASR